MTRDAEIAHAQYQMEVAQLNQVAEYHNAREQIRALPDHFTPVDGAVEGQAPGVADPATKDANRDAATALIRIASGVDVAQLTEGEQQGLQTIGAELGSEMVKGDAGGAVVTDKARRWLSDMAPAAAKMLPLSEAERAKQISGTSQDASEGTVGVSSNDSTPTATEKPKKPAKAKAGAASVEFTGENGHRVKLAVPTGATVPSSGVAVTNTSTAAKWLAETQSGNVRDVEYTPGKVEAPSKPAAKSKPKKKKPKAKKSTAGAMDLAISYRAGGKSSKEAVVRARDVVKKLKAAAARYGDLFHGVRFEAGGVGSGGVGVDENSKDLVAYIEDLARAGDNLTDDRIDKLVSEEAIHRVALELEHNGKWNAEALWNQLSAKTKAAFTLAYQQERMDELPAWNMGHEMVRMIVQGRLSILENGKLAVDGVAISEDTVSAKLKEILADILTQLRDYFINLADTLKRDENTPDAVAEVERVVNLLTRQMAAITNLPESESEASSAQQTEAGADATAPASTTTAKESKGEKIAKGWREFAPDSGTLGIPRNEMPQVHSEDRGALIQFLQARGIDHRQEKVLPATLKPTQAEYNDEKVNKARRFKGANRAILVSSDNHVVDGHHQYVAAITDAPDEPIRIIRLNSPIQQLIEAVSEFPSATTSRGATASKPKEKSKETQTRAQNQGQQAEDLGHRKTERTEDGKEGQRLLKTESAKSYGLEVKQVGDVETVTHLGNSYKTVYAVVESDSLVTSNNPDGTVRTDYPQTLQPRDRSEGVYREQQRKIALHPNMDEEAIRGVPDRGVPTVALVDGKPIILIGNGRQNANQLRYESNDMKAPAEQYQDNIMQLARERGIGRGVVAGMNRPVLVRLLVGENRSEAELRQMSQESNQFAGAATNSTEQAKQDAGRLTSEILAFYERGYDVGAKRNLSFRQQFVRDVIGRSENISDKDLERRIMAAMFAKAYGESEAGRDAFERLIGENDAGVRNIINAMMDNAADMALMKDRIALGTLHPLEIGREVSKAVQEIAVALRDKPAKQKVDTALDGLIAQGELGGIDERTDFEREVLGFLVNNRRTKAEVSRVLANYVSLIYGAGDPRQEDMFSGGGIAPPVKFFKAAQISDRSEKLASGRATAAEELNRKLQAGFGGTNHSKEDFVAAVERIHSLAQSERDGFLKDVLTASRRAGMAAAVKDFNSAVKKLKKAIAKLDRKPAVPSDLLRATVISRAQTPDGARRKALHLVEAFSRAGYLIYNPDGQLDLTDRINDSNAEGYRDIALKFVKEGDGASNVVREVLVLQPAMKKAKNRIHDFYDRKRELEASLLLESEPDVQVMIAKKIHHYGVKITLLGRQAFLRDNPALASSSEEVSRSRSAFSSGERSFANNLNESSDMRSNTLAGNPSSFTAFATSDLRSATDRALDISSTTPAREIRQRELNSGQADFFSTFEAEPQAAAYVKTLPPSAKKSIKVFKAAVKKDIPSLPDAAFGDLFALAAQNEFTNPNDGSSGVTSTNSNNEQSTNNPRISGERESGGTETAGGESDGGGEAIAGGLSTGRGAGRTGAGESGRSGMGGDRKSLLGVGTDSVAQADNAGDEGGATDGLPESAQSAEHNRVARVVRYDPAKLSADEQDFVLPEGDIAPRTITAKYAANVEAIRLMRQIEEDGRFATPAEKLILAAYTGWGWAGEYFNPDNSTHRAKFNAVKELLTDAEWRDARDSASNAHFTSPKIIRAMWDAARKLGFKGGTILEPAGGVGHFFGAMPTDLRAYSDLRGIELDSLSARIFTLLYPQANIVQQGFQDSKIPNNSVDLAISNVPFGNYKVPGGHDYPKLLIHDYFFARSLDKVKPGGLVMFVTSDGTLQKGDAKVRRMLADKADLVAAIRLPNNAFAANAGTEVTTDILILRKKDASSYEGEVFQGLTTVGQAPVKLKDGTTEDQDIRVNEYFAAHPEMALGRHTLEGTMYSAGDYAMVANRGENLDERLATAIEALPANVMNQDKVVIDTAKNGGEAEAGLRDGDHVENDAGIWIVSNGQLEPVDEPVDGVRLWGLGSDEGQGVGLVILAVLLGRRLRFDQHSTGSGMIQFPSPTMVQKPIALYR